MKKKKTEVFCFPSISIDLRKYTSDSQSGSDTNFGNAPASLVCLFVVRRIIQSVVILNFKRKLPNPTDRNSNRNEVEMFSTNFQTLQSTDASGGHGARVSKWPVPITMLYFRWNYFSFHSESYMGCVPECSK